MRCLCLGGGRTASPFRWERGYFWANHVPMFVQIFSQKGSGPILTPDPQPHGSSPVQLWQECKVSRMIKKRGPPPKIVIAKQAITNRNNKCSIKTFENRNIMKKVRIWQIWLSRKSGIVPPTLHTCIHEMKVVFVKPNFITPKQSTL